MQRTLVSTHTFALLSLIFQRERGEETSQPVLSSRAGEGVV